jgi:hypothetical protein
MRMISTTAAIAVMLSGWASVAAADPDKDESGKGRWRAQLRVPGSLRPRAPPSRASCLQAGIRRQLQVRAQAGEERRVQGRREVPERAPETHRPVLRNGRTMYIAL